MNNYIKHKEGITVRDLKNLLADCPDEAIVLLNHCCEIHFEEDNGKTIKYKAWDFDPIVEARCEEIEDDDRYRYPEWKSNNKLVWLTHQVE